MKRRKRALAVAVILVLGAAIAPVSADLASATTRYSKSAVLYDAFIPQSRIDAPATGCDYNGSAYQYAGDGRGFQAAGYPYRLSIEAYIDWNNGGSVTSVKSVGTTSVYKKSTGALISQRTASSSNLTVTRLGGSATSVDLRFFMSVGNPFCNSLTAISGTFTIHVTRDGKWSITSGEHKKMPNHEVYIQNGSRWSTVFQHPYASVWCTVNGVCENYNLTGLYGTY